MQKLYPAGAFAATTFLGAFLSFLVQPLITRHILPWFGGASAVWTTAMMFFQLTLLAGYAYTHLLVARFALRRQVLVHLCLLACALCLQPLAPDAAWKSAGADDPRWRIVLVLATSVGLPFLLLSSTTPLMQSWLHRVNPWQEPYNFYALSNLGSILGLALYPLAIEPLLGVARQALLWSLGFGAFVCVTAWSGMRLYRQSRTLAGQSVAATRGGQRLSPGRVLDWLALSALAVVVLLAATNQLCKDVAVIPMLWILPLGLYLVSFIVCFGRPAWYRRSPWAALLVVSLVTVTWLLHQDFEAEVPLPFQIAVYSLTVFSCCMVMHGEVYRLRPPAEQLTAFYLALSVGGALGGVLVNLVAPLVFDGYWEFHLGLLGTVLILGWLVRRDWRLEPPTARRRACGFAWLAGCAGLAVALALHVQAQTARSIAAERSFYGMLRVYEQAQGSRHRQREFFHGRILHGAQYLDAPYRTRPLSYYGPSSGVWLGVQVQRLLARQRTDRQSLRIGVVGEGAAAFAAHGRAGDLVRFYEIDPAVDRFARTHFSYLAESDADTEVVLGDARISLERELAQYGPQAYDLLVLDAFSGDGIPVHLLTREALVIYRRHLATGGVIAVHISNRHFDLRPVIYGLAADAGLEALFIDGDGESFGETASDWMLLSGNEKFLRQVRLAAARPSDSPMKRLLWTDDRATPLDVLVVD